MTTQGSEAMTASDIRRVRMDDDLWDRFETAVHEMDSYDSRSAVIRRLVRWYVGDVDDMPRRPKDNKERT